MILDDDDDDDDDEESDDEVEDDDNNDKDILALGLDRDMGFSRGLKAKLKLEPCANIQQESAAK